MTSNSKKRKEPSPQELPALPALEECSPLQLFGGQKQPSKKKRKLVLIKKKKKTGSFV